MSLDSFQEIFSSLFSRGGGRRPQEPHQPGLDDHDHLKNQAAAHQTNAAANDNLKQPPSWLLQPLADPDNQVRLTIVQITDVYTLDNFASLRTMIQTIRASRQNSANDKVITMLTGDFLAPYLLSSIDHGKGMMMAINETPIDYLTWGNHEADIPHKHVCQHAKNYQGTFINSNMQSHDTMQYPNSVPYEIIQVTDGRHTRKIGLVAVLSNDPKLYSHFKQPAFGGATIEDPWETLAHYKTILEQEHGCDLVIPLEHCYVPENTRTCQQFDFPLILSGHDHHRIDQVIQGTRLIKPGMDGVHASVVEIVFDKRSPKPSIRSTFVETALYPPCPILKQKTDAAYDVLLPLRNTMLASVLPSFRPLTSKNARGSTCTMGKLVCSMLKQALWQSQQRSNSNDDGDNSLAPVSLAPVVDAVILMGGNIRGNEDYPDDSFFSLETLEAEIKSDEVIGFVDMPGHILAAGIEATHSGEPIPGWFQYDDGIAEANGKVTTVGGKPLEPHRVYRVATKIKDLTNGQSPPFTAYYKVHPELLPSKGQYINIHSELMAFFARGMFRKLWEATGDLINPEVADVTVHDNQKPSSPERLEGKLRLSVLDRDQDGYVSVDDIHLALRDYLGLSVDDNYKTLAEHVHELADATGNGQVTVEDFEVFCRTGIPREVKLQEPKWNQVFPDPLPEISPVHGLHGLYSGKSHLLDALSDTTAGESSTGTEAKDDTNDDITGTDQDDNESSLGDHFPDNRPFIKRHNTEPTEPLAAMAEGAAEPPLSEITVQLVE